MSIAATGKGEKVLWTLLENRRASMSRPSIPPSSMDDSRGTPPKTGHPQQGKESGKFGGRMRHHKVEQTLHLKPKSYPHFGMLTLSGSLKTTIQSLASLTSNPPQGLSNCMLCLRTPHTTTTPHHPPNPIPSHLPIKPHTSTHPLYSRPHSPTPQPPPPPRP